MDDGCSNSPDSFFGFNLRWCCRIHDWRYCSRCHPNGRMKGQQKPSDRELRANISSVLPWRWRWVKWVYWRAVKSFGKFSYDTCGPDAGSVCRHDIHLPWWMEETDDA